jgi:uncharacterized membrane protein YgcG
MSFRSIKRGLVASAAVGALVVPATAGAATLRGVVVHHNHRAHSLVIATRTGRLASVHTRKRPRLGRVVAVRAKLLRNGTYAAKHISVRHRLRRRVRVHGVVTFVNRRKGEFTVSAGGASLLVRRHRTAAAADGMTSTDPLPSVGDEVTVETEIDDQGDLEDHGVHEDGGQADSAEVEGTILAIDTTANTLTISADEDGESGQSITVDVPSTIDISQFQTGQEVKLNVSVQPDGSFLLQGLSEDGDSHQANNPDDQEGCSGEGPCSGSGSGHDGSGSGGSGSGGSGQDTSGGDTSGGDVSGGDVSGSGSNGSDG